MRYLLTNGLSTKSHNCRENLLLAITILLTVMFSVIACGGDKIPNGTYVSESESEEFYVFSGKNVSYRKQGPETYTLSLNILVDFGNRSNDTQNSNVKNKVEEFRSKILLQSVAQKLNLNVEYSHVGKLKTEILYDRSPIEVSFLDAKDASMGFQMEANPDNNVTISKIFLKSTNFNETITGKFNDTIDTPIGKILINPTKHYSSTWNFVPLNVDHYSIESITAVLLSGLNSRLSSKDNAIIVLEFTDRSIARAEDVLNTLFDVYNENWVYEKKIVAERTAIFIDERIEVVESELKIIDDEVEAYKRRHLLTNVQEAASIYLRDANINATKSM